MRAPAQLIPMTLAAILAACHEELVTGPVDTPSYVESMLGRWDYSAEFAFERAHAVGDTVWCNITGAVLQIAEPIAHDEGFLSAAYRPQASLVGGALQCTGATTFAVSLDEANREASARASLFDLEIHFDALTTIGRITIASGAWRDPAVSGDLVTDNVWAGRVWAGNAGSYGGYPFPVSGTFRANKR